MKQFIATLLLLIVALATARAASISTSATRDPAQVRAFRHDHACPSTHEISGACPGYVVDHIIPLCLGGVDEPRNMQWQSRADALAKDKLEWEACHKAAKQCNSSLTPGATAPS